MPSLSSYLPGCWQKLGMQNVKNEYYSICNIYITVYVIYILQYMYIFTIFEPMYYITDKMAAPTDSAGKVRTKFQK